jgi:hypothetical protein
MTTMKNLFENEEQYLKDLDSFTYPPKLDWEEFELMTDSEMIDDGLYDSIKRIRKTRAMIHTVHEFIALEQDLEDIIEILLDTHSSTEIEIIEDFKKLQSTYPNKLNTVEELDGYLHIMLNHYDRLKRIYLEDVLAGIAEISK